MDSSMWRLLPGTLHAYRSFRHWLKALERYWKAVHTIHKLFLIVLRTWGARGPVQGATRWAPNPLPWRVRNGWKLSGSYISYRIDRKHPNFKPIDMNSGNQTDSVPWATATLQHVGKFMEVPTMLCQCLFVPLWGERYGLPLGISSSENSVPFFSVFHGDSDFHSSGPLCCHLWWPNLCFSKKKWPRERCQRLKISTGMALSFNRWMQNACPSTTNLQPPKLFPT